MTVSLTGKFIPGILDPHHLLNDIRSCYSINDMTGNSLHIQSSLPIAEMIRMIASCASYTDSTSSSRLRDCYIIFGACSTQQDDAHRYCYNIEIAFFSFYLFSLCEHRLAAWWLLTEKSHNLVGYCYHETYHVIGGRNVYYIFLEHSETHRSLK